MQQVYLDNMPLKDAQKLFLEKVSLKDNKEIIKTVEGLNRVTSEAIFAKRSMPFFSASAMDGIVVRASDTSLANELNPCVLKKDKDFFLIDTGDPIPDGFDAVIMIEDVAWLEDGNAEILAPATPWQHVRPVGEDVVFGEIIVSSHHKLTPPDLGVLLAGGATEIEVLKKPRINIIPTGTELIRAEEEVTKGKIVDFNSTVIKAYVSEWGAEAKTHPIIKDDWDLLKKGILESLKDCDMLIINAGSSAGREDYTSKLISELGEVFVHGVRTRPGKPVILGEIQGKPVVGLPGYPVSAYLALEWFVKPLLEKYFGQPNEKREKLKVTLGRRVVSSMGKEEFVRMTLGNVDGRFLANPLNRGAGVTMSLVKAQGLLRIPENSLGYNQGEEVEIELLRSLEVVKNTLVVVGSHDLCIDLLTTLVRKAYKDYFVSSAHVGSMGGLLAIKRKEAHVAGVHLLDPETGEYNIPYVKKYLADEDVVLINLVHREQGFIIPKGNSLNIKSIKDIIAKELLFINRQKGAGTRILFDHLIKENNLDKDSIKGYKREEFSHFGVAAAVNAKTADVGMGIKSAALAYDLDFIPVGEERYDLLLEKSFLNTSLGKLLLQIINSEEFKEEVNKLGGYSTRDTGKIIWES